MDSLAENLATMTRRRLTPHHVALLREAGVEEALPEGAILYRSGDRADRFIFVLDGEIELRDPVREARIGPGTIGPGQFVGEIAFLNGGAVLNTIRVCKPSRVIVIPRQAVLDLMAVTPEMSDVIVSVLAARRRAALEAGLGAINVIGPSDDRRVREIEAFADRNRLPIRLHEPDSPEAEALRAACRVAPGDWPQVIFGEGETLPEATPLALARRLGLGFEPGDLADYDVVIVGAGPAGVAAAVYAGAEGLCALVVEDLAIGGQAGTASRIENYMGFPTGISGADLCWRGGVQAMKFGARFAMPHRVTALDPEDAGWRLTLDGSASVTARAVVVATGVQYRRLPLPRLDELEGAGVYYAATDTEARYCRGSEVVVIGGGNSAGQAAMFLCRSARHVHLVVREDSLVTSMSSYLIDRLAQDPGVTIHLGSEVAALEGGDRLEAVVIGDRTAARDWRLETRALFVMVGGAPNTGWLQGRVALDRNGFILTGAAAGATGQHATSAPGIYAVGDVRAGSVKRVASAVGEGSVVMSDVWVHVREP